MESAAIDEVDPRSSDVAALIAAHLTFARDYTPAADVHALDQGSLLDPSVTLFGLRVDGELLAVGALRQLDTHHGELKSMHTAEAARGRGLGRAMVSHLVEEARSRGCNRVSLETATYDAFAPSRALYRATGFVECEPFGDYEASPTRVCMTRSVD
ncbi:MAG: GNAT family N-acetyltransferase [Acidimicrobiales bacterium]